MENMTEVWKRYCEQDDQQAREELILHYARLVKYVVSRLVVKLPASLQREDLISYGVLGLMEAVDRFDPSHGVKFGTYAIPRIRGQIIDSLRSLDMLPRSVYRQTKEIEKAISELSQILGRTPNDQEVADYLEISLIQYHSWLTDASFIVVSLDRSALSDDGDQALLYDSLEDTKIATPSQDFDSRELKADLATIIQELPDREQLLLSLYYKDGLTMKEIGKVLGVSESRVSQMHAKIILTLRGWLKCRTEPKSAIYNRKDTNVPIYTTT
jgi:RNA polymerase sigma factor for flagellar operon FliA